MPVVGGNVSLYNEAPTGPIFPTPVVGIVGKLPDAARAGRLGFAQEGDAIALVGPFAPSLVGSELAKLLGERADREAPAPSSRRLSATRTGGPRRRPLGRVPQRPRHRRGRHRGRACRVLHRGWHRRDGQRCPEYLHLFAEAPGRGFIVSGRAEDLAESLIIGRVGGSGARDRRSIEARSFRARVWRARRGSPELV